MVSHLAAFAGVDAIVEPRGHVTTYLTQQHHAIDLCKAKQTTIIAGRYRHVTYLSTGNILGVQILSL